MGAVWISIVSRNDGEMDVEVLDSQPTESFIDGLTEVFLAGEINGFQIREGNINGGDSIVIFQSNG
jgi:hypothetical protein